MADDFDSNDVMYMTKALELARNGEGRVSPNPPVGCVLVKDGRIVGRGWHDRLGDLHAEAAAIRDAGPAARDSVCYVTLTPCATSGRQPACADALVKAGVAEVVIAAEDPNPKNAPGADLLRRAGIPVRTGLLREEAEYVARGFFKLTRYGLPYLTLKYAMTLDGKIASATGDSKWVSGEESRELVQDMRSRADAIMVGAQTALTDDPKLTVRESALAMRGGPDAHPQPLRIVVDSRARLPVTAAMLKPDKVPGGMVLVATTQDAPNRKVMDLAGAGAEVVKFSSPDYKVPLRDLLAELAERGVAMVLCEGGGRIAAGLFAEGLVDEVVAFVAPKIMGGEQAPGPVADLGFARMSEAVGLVVGECIPVGDDIMIKALVRRSASGRFLRS